MENGQSGISAIDRALIILEALAAAPQGLTVTDLSAQLQINKGLTFRILSSLAHREYVYKDESTQHYRISIRLLGLAFQHLKVLDVYDVLLPILRRLAQETGELAELNWVEQGRMVTVAKADSPRQLRVVSYLGQEQALHATASGKVYLASLPIEEALQRAIVNGLTAFTPSTITEIEAVKRELDLVRDQGYATNNQESSEHVLAVAAPIRALADDGRVVGSVGVVSPDFHEIHVIRGDRANHPRRQRDQPRLATSAPRGLAHFRRRPSDSTFTHGLPGVSKLARRSAACPSIALPGLGLEHSGHGRRLFGRC